MNHVEAGQDWRATFEQRLTDGLRDLLQKKHLYQSVTIECDDHFGKLKNQITISNQIGAFISYVRNWQNANWAVNDPANPATWSGYRPILVSVPDVKLSCVRCERLEAF